MINIKKLSVNLWESGVKNYLLFDAKLKPTKHTLEGHFSRFKKIACYFQDHNLDWSRQAFTDFLSQFPLSDYSPSFFNNLIKTAKHIDRYLGCSELAGFKYFKETPHFDKEIFTHEEMVKIINTPLEYSRLGDETNLRYCTITQLLWETGCRINEAQLLLREDVKDLGEICCVIFRDTKSREDRHVPITRSTYNQIRSIPVLGKYVFSTIKDLPFHRTTYSGDLKNRALKAGINKLISPHLIRHSMITYCGRKGRIPIKLLMEIVGHKSMEVTERYMHDTLFDLQSALSRGHPAFRGEQNIKSLVETVKEVLSELVDTSRFSLSTWESANGIKIELADLNVELLHQSPSSK